MLRCDVREPRGLEGGPAVLTPRAQARGRWWFATSVTLMDGPTLPLNDTWCCCECACVLILVRGMESSGIPTCSRWCSGVRSGCECEYQVPCRFSAICVRQGPRELGGRGG